MKIVVIGGVAAGSKAAAKSKRLLKDAQVDIYTQDSHVSYSACGLPYYIQGNFADYKNLIIRTPQEFEASGINVHLYQKVIKILPDTKQILVRDLLSSEEYYVDYDKLVIATGASPYKPNIKNIGLKNVFTLRTLEDGITLREKMYKSKKAVISGCGYIGLEVLEAFVSNKVHTTVIEKNPRILSFLDNEVSLIVQNFVKTLYPEYTTIINNDEITEFIGEDEILSVKTRNNKIIDTDYVLISSGIRPNVDIAVDAGINLGDSGAIKVNSRMETNIEDIYACGDCIEEVYAMTGTPAWIPLGSTANKEGRCAAMNLCGFADDFPGVLGSAVTKYFGLTISRTGFTETFAKQNGFDVVSILVTKHDKAGYMPDVENVTIKLIADKRNHKLLGGQAVGCGDADKRINALATAIFEGMTVEQLSDADITYAPPFSTSIDPLLFASRILADKLKD